MKTRHTFLYFWLLLFPLTINAQEMAVKSMVLVESDITANLEENLHQDLNGNYSGLVKVYLAASGAQFLGPSVLGQQAAAVSEYWVFMAKNAFKLQVTAPGYLPLDVNFRDYGIEGVESRRTYRLIITLPQLNTTMTDTGMQYLTMSVEPKNCSVFIDGTPQQVENGEVNILLSKGTHKYMVSSPGYTSKEGNVVIGEQKKEMAVVLKNAMSTLRVECDTKDAELYINNQKYGKMPWNGSLSPGNYQVEARLKGYKTAQQSVSLGNNENRTLRLPALGRPMGILNVKVTPSKADVFIDGVKRGTTPEIFRDIPVGGHQLEIKKAGYKTLSKVITVEENKQYDFSGVLQTNGTNTVSTEVAPTAPVANSQEVGGSISPTKHAAEMALKYLHAEPTYENGQKALEWANKADTKTKEQVIETLKERDHPGL